MSPRAAAGTGVWEPVRWVQAWSKALSAALGHGLEEAFPGRQILLFSFSVLALVAACWLQVITKTSAFPAAAFVG